MYKRQIIPFPDFQKLKEEIEKLRKELSMLVLERDELRFVICKNIEMEYMLKVGGLEYQAYEAECAFLRLKRKVEPVSYTHLDVYKRQLPRIPRACGGDP